MDMLRRGPGRPALEDVERRVLAEAARRFARRGYEKTTVEDLIRGAGVSRATFYKRFDSREDVLAELYRRESERHRAQVLAALAEARDAWDMIRRGVAAYFHAAAAAGPLYPELARLQMANKRLLGEREQIVAGYVAALQKLLSERSQLPVPDFVIDAFLISIDRVAQRTLVKSMTPKQVDRLLADAERAIMQYLPAMITSFLARGA
jgi:AcrR family transcriptional regulator